MEINAENRTAITNNRRCSFCKIPGHYINNCNSPRLNNFERSCFNEIELSVRYHEHPRQRFHNWLFEYAIHNNDMIKAYAISKLGISIRNRRIGDIVDDVHNYYCERYSVPHIRINSDDSNSLGDITNRLNHINLDNNLDDIIDSLILLNSIGTLRIENFIHNKVIDLKVNLEEQANNVSYEIEKQIECCICYEEKEYKNFIKLECNHEFCKECIKSQIKYTKKNYIRCGLCRNDIGHIKVKTNEILEEIKSVII
jgi:hypothetical protein